MDYRHWAEGFHIRVNSAIATWLPKAGYEASKLLRSLREKAHQWWYFLAHPQIPPDNIVARSFAEETSAGSLIFLSHLATPLFIFCPVLRDGICFEKYLEVFSETFPNELHIIQLDNGGFHRRLDLEIPQNIILLFQPPYCPELNPIERLWQHLKRPLRWQNFNDLEELRQKLREILNSLTTEVIASVTGWQFILEALSVAGI